MTQARLHFLVFALLAASCGPAFADETKPPVDKRPHDEFGLRPDDSKDRDLSLPDRFLDRNYTGPLPGERPKADAFSDDDDTIDEDEVDPFREGVKPRAPDVVPDDEEALPSKPSRPPVGPDGRFDAGSPSPGAEPDLEDPLTPDFDEPSDLERDEQRPSPFAHDNDDFDDEMPSDDGGGDSGGE